MAVGTVSNYEGATGAIDTITGAHGEVFIKVYNNTGAAVNNGDVYFLNWKRDSSSGARPTLEAVATSTVARQVVVVNNAPLARDSIANGKYGYVQLRGYCPKVKSANTVAIDDFLAGTNASQTAADDGTSQTGKSFGIATTAYAGGFVEAILFGEPVTV